MKVLLTGFDPFGGESVNPAFEAIKLLPSTIAGAEIVYVEIPTEFKKSAPAVEAAIKEHNPDIVISISAGVCNKLIIEWEKQKPNIPRSTLRIRKLINDVDTIVFILL